MVYALTEDDKWILTEYLGECWHERKKEFVCETLFRNSHYIYKCIKCGDSSLLEENNSCKFHADDWSTFGLLKNKIVEDGKWHQFIAWVNRDSYYGSFLTSLFIDDIINPSRFFWLAAKAIKEEVI